MITKNLSYHCYDCLDSLSCNLLPTSPLHNTMPKILHIKSDPLQHWVRGTAGVLNQLCNSLNDIPVFYIEVLRGFNGKSLFAIILLDQK